MRRRRGFWPGKGLARAWQGRRRTISVAGDQADRTTKEAREWNATGSSGIGFSSG